MAVTDHERTVINDRFAEAMYETARHDMLVRQPGLDPVTVRTWGELDPMSKRPYREAALHISTDFLEIVEQVVGNRIWQDGYVASLEDQAISGSVTRTANPYPLVVS